MKYDKKICPIVDVDGIMAAGKQYDLEEATSFVLSSLQQWNIKEGENVIEVYDLAKNHSTYQFIYDTTAPEVTYEINDQQVIIHAQEDITFNQDGWTQVDNYTWTKTLAQETQIDLVVTDLAGNQSNLHIDIPQNNVDQPTDDNQNIVISSAGETFTKTIVLKRQVAGTYGYFTNIPAKGPKGEVAKTLRLVAAAKNKQVVLDGFDKGNAVNGKASADDESGVFFNDGSTKGFVVYSINLDSWFTAGDDNEDGLLNADDTWAAGITESGVTFKDGSVFGGKFLVPFSAVESANNSLQLQLLDGSGNILRYWNVNLAAAQEDVIDITAGEPAAADELSTSSYSVLRNHLYTLGMRKAGDNGGDDDPDGDEDKPEDLNKGQQLVIKVSGAWENITGMVLD